MWLLFSIVVASFQLTMFLLLLLQLFWGFTYELCLKKQRVCASVSWGTFLQSFKKMDFCFEGKKPQHLKMSLFLQNTISLTFHLINISKRLQQQSIFFGVPKTPFATPQNIRWRPHTYTFFNRHEILQRLNAFLHIFL